MPDPVDLPPELFRTILRYALDDNNECDIRYLSRLCLLNRPWYAHVAVRLYSERNYNDVK